eukprot:8020961-Lingulodinium_polyedra.AAC.1
MRARWRLPRISVEFRATGDGRRAQRGATHWFKTARPSEKAHVIMASTICRSGRRRARPMIQT